jgi:hypothetical protein
MLHNGGVGSKQVWLGCAQQFKKTSGSICQSGASGSFASLMPKTSRTTAIWEDGETLGDPVWIERLLSPRQSQATAYSLAIALLRQGVEQSWTFEQYRQALSDKPNSLPFVSLKSTLDANERLSQHPVMLRHVMQTVLDYFTRRYEGFQRSEPTVEDLLLL